MTALTATARAIALDCALSIDMAAATGDADWAARAALLTPIAKAFGTDVGCEVAALAVQVHGGMGYVEETGVAQYYRDVRVTPIYEGTNGVQAMDLVGRKLADGGAAARRLLAEIEATAASAGGEPGARLAEAAGALAATTEWMLAAETERPLRRGHALPAGLRADPRRPLPLRAAAAEADPEGPRAALAAFHLRQMLPQVAALCATAREGAAGLYALDLAS